MKAFYSVGMFSRRLIPHTIVDIIINNMQNAKEGDSLPRTEAQKRAHLKYEAKYAKTLGLRVKLDVAEIIETHARNRGETVNAFLLRAVREQIRRDNGAGPDDANT